MSGALKMAKKKYSQQELRRQLTCVLCRSIVRSEAVWKVHINSKQHKENVEVAKQLKECSTRTSSSVRDSALPSKDTELPSKRAAPSFTTEDSIPMKKPKGILKNSQNASAQSGTLPNDFFDDSRKVDGEIASSIRKELVNIRRPEKHLEHRVETMEQDPAGMDVATALPLDEEKLPEGFFDDPKMDAKARNQEYKDPNDEEWEKFQKEIKEATNVSMAIISEEQEESTAERQIAEIDEQIRNWSRVLDLEKKKEQVQIMKGTSTSTRSYAKIANSVDGTIKLKIEDDDEDDDDDEFDEFLDWRAKKSYK
uniref:Zinc finger protein 830 n=1 Tax=Anopheles atroparvus TaxID=41427 RepID=A0A182IQX6_ANOAO